MASEQYRTAAYALRIGFEWFGGFGGKPGGPPITKLRAGLCDAMLMWDSKKAEAYIKRLKERGFDAVAVIVTAAPNNPFNGAETGAEAGAAS